MRKFIVIFALLGAILIGTSSTASAVVLSFNMNITNNCNPFWTGNYCVELYVTYGGFPVCPSIIKCTVPKSGCCSFDFDIKDQAADNQYGVYIIRASESNGNCLNTISLVIGGNWYWDDMTSCTKTLAFTLN